MARLSKRIAMLVLLHLAMPVIDAAESVPGLVVRHIYRCEVAGVTIFADRPCDAGMHPYDLELSRLSVLGAPEPPKQGKAAAPRPSVSRRASKPAQSDVAAEAARAEACRRLQQSLRKIASRMRAGYKAKAGERLQEQRRELEAKLRARRC